MLFQWTSQLIKMGKKQVEDVSVMIWSFIGIYSKIDINQSDLKLDTKED